MLVTLNQSEADWSCTICRSKPSKGRKSIVLTSAPNPNNSATQENSADHLNTSTDLTSIKSSVSSMQSSIQFFSDKFDEFKVQLDNFEALIARVDLLEKTVGDLQKTVDGLTVKLNGLEQNNNERDLVLCGIPEVENDQRSTTDLVLDFFAVANTPAVSRLDIRTAFRIKSQQTANTLANARKPAKILVKFHSSKIRDAIKNAIRSLKNEQRCLAFCNQNVDFYAADHLTPFFNQLFYSAKDVADNKRCYKVWVCNSNILVKKTASSVPIIVRNFNDLNKI
jgi:hypothetical protein